MSNRSVSPNQFVEGALFHRTLQALYDCLHDADSRGLQQTLDGSHKCLAVLTLISKRNPGCFILPIIHVLPINADADARPKPRN